MLERKYVLYYALIIYGLLQFAGIVFQTMYFCVIDINLASLALTVVADLEYAGEVLAFLVELAVVVNYIVFLRQARADSARQDTDRLALVARYGIASFCCFQLYLFATVGFCYVNAGVEPIVSVGFYTALYCLQQLFPIAYIQIQLGMKWSISIAREKVRDAPTVIIMSGAKTSLGKLSSMQS
ncbi:hypothetical protein BC830DRAFT_1156097 [Chytriomyces sp. MP71]|nr:hypothetical protein BC830DRAFT_1156097 [Chytriomyces sp. MP71]